jgi:glyoxylase-like metal-dependent hydrolase (beta-lactamase superfamily II)
MRLEVVLNGYLVRTPDSIIPKAASSTVTLVGESCLIDTGSRNVRKELERRLKGKKIDLILHTHNHPDHQGNDGIFPHAKIPDVEEGTFRMEGIEVQVLSTPGHSLDSISFLVEGDDGLVYAVAGDAIPIEDNFEKWVPPAIHYDREEALRSMEKIVERADIIIPGHDKPFRNTRKD